MKTSAYSHIATLILCVLSASSVAQTTYTNTPPTSPLPTVTVRALVGNASESGQTGLWRITRSKTTNAPLSVSISMSGNAQNGVDYERIPSEIIIPAGQGSVDVTLTPIEDTEPEPTETALLYINGVPGVYHITGITSDPAMGLSNIVYIADNDPNLPPVVEMLSPTNGTTLTYPATIAFRVAASDPEDKLLDVGIYNGTNFFCFLYPLLQTNGVKTGIYTGAWSSNFAGTLTLTAVALDRVGAMSTSTPVVINITRPPTNEPVIVTVTATDSAAGELLAGSTSAGTTQMCNPGIFTITRTGDTNSALTVFYSLTGTASNGVDYVRLPYQTVIPAGSKLGRVVVTPIDDKLVESNETVILTLEAPVCPAVYPPPPGCYQVGSPDSAVVVIQDNDVATNIPPFVTITTPRNGMSFPAPAQIPIFASAGDRDDAVDSVEFFEGTNSLGVVTRLTNSLSAVYPFSMLWSNVKIGTYVLTALATDSRGASTRSPSVTIKVVEKTTNSIPVVTITAIDAFASEGIVRLPIYKTNGNVILTNSTAGGPVITNGWTSYTNTATFRVSRSGATNSALTVTYAVDGTASNGMDYATLPGSITIPASKRWADIVLRPIEDTLVEGAETVRLTLTSPMAALPAGTDSTTASFAPIPPYLIGTPSRASATIADNDFPLRPTRLPDGQYYWNASGSSNVLYLIQMTTDFVNWTTVCTNAVIDGAVSFVDPDSADFKRRFYRAIPLQ